MLKINKMQIFVTKLSEKIENFENNVLYLTYD